ncbi:MAG: AGE family epimerase/isomerase [Saprospiraceae bacterium]|nr:AGE family epimerase/isomerase [Saprospiraceae bacterium]
MFRKTLLLLFGVGGLLNLLSCQSPKDVSDPVSFLGVPKAEIQQELDHLVELWYPRIIDTVNGGYWTNFEYDWSRSDDQPKMLVTQARGLWTAARLAQFYPDRPSLVKAAEHGFRFLTEKLWDEGKGGFVLQWPVKENAPDYRLTYANAFALYALAEYAKINSEPKVLQWVERSFEWLETHAHDQAFGGYFNLVIFDEHIQENLGWGDGEWKGQNTSIHLLEAITNTYQVLPLPSVKKRLEEMLLLVRDTFVRENGSLQLYFTNDWSAVDYTDSTRQFILDHIHDDHVSFGHDIETAFLLYEAAMVWTGGNVDEKTQVVTKRMIDHCLATGFEEGFQGLFDKGYYFQGQEGIEVTGRHKSWWAQAEAWHALALFSGLFPEAETYPVAFAAMWTYMQEQLIDHQHGGWYNAGLDESPKVIRQRKAHQWKGAYHNGRALMQVLEYAQGEQAKH